jgi:foldase protein PrsA
LALGAFFVLAGLLVACGSGVPGNAVARVDDEVIKQRLFDHWVQVAAASSQPPGAGAKPSVPDPPTYRRCVAEKRTQIPAPPGRPPQIPDSQLRQQCQQEWDLLREQVMQFLIQSLWLQGEAEDQDVKVSAKEVNDSFQRQKRQSFPNEADYQRFLASSGMTQQDILLRVKLDLISTKIRDKVTKGKDKVTEKQIQQYYAKNKQRFAQPEQRDIDLVLTKTRAQALRAKSMIEGGQSWSAVARRSSIDQASKSQGGRLSSVIPGQQEQALDQELFEARRGALVGPIKTQFGYYIFRVTRIVPGSQQSLPEVRETIKRIIQSQNQQTALQNFVKSFEKKWKSQTNCRKGYVVQICKNAPTPKRTSTVPPGGIPQGAPPGGGAAPGAPPSQGGPPPGAPEQGAPPSGP